MGDFIDVKVFPEKPQVIYHAKFLSFIWNAHAIDERRVTLRILQYLQRYMSLNSTIKDFQENGLNDLTLNIPTRELMPDGSQNHTRLRQVICELDGKGEEIKAKDSSGEYFTKAKLIKDYKYYENGQMVKFTIDKKILPFLLALGANFVRYKFEIAFSLKTTRAISLYILLCHWAVKKKKMYFSVSHIRNALGLKDDVATSEIVRSVLKPLKKKLEKNADVYFETDFKKPVKKGKRIDGWVFTIIIKPGSPLLDSEDYYVEEDRKQVIRNFLKRELGMTSNHLSQIHSLIENPTTNRRLYTYAKSFREKIDRYDYKSRGAYSLKSIKNHFNC